MQVIRQRRRPAPNVLAALYGRMGRRARLVIASAAVLAIAGTGSGIVLASTIGLGTEQADRTYNGGLVLPDDQVINPIGDRLVLDSGKIMASTVSPDGTHLAALTADGAASLTIVDLQNYKVQQLVGTSSSDDLKIGDSTVGQQGPTYSPDGSKLWVPVMNGYDVYPVNADGSMSAPTVVSIPADGSKHALSAQTAFSADGSTVYADINGQNRVVAIDAATGQIEQSWSVGIAPRGIVRIGDKLYVSDEGGRMPVAGDTTINSYGTQVPANPETGASTTGTVSVINLDDPSAAVQSINVGLHPTAMYATSDGTLFVANTFSDTVSVIDTGSDQVVQTIATQPWPEAKVGYEPNGITMTSDGHLLVTLARANAVAVYQFVNAHAPVRYIGLLPTDYVPSAVNVAGGQIVVSNTRGIDDQRPDPFAPGAHNTHDTTGSLTRFTLPSDLAIAGDTSQVFQNNGWTNKSVLLANGKQVPPVPVPLRIGDPSTIKYVWLIVKENRTYDQQFGDIPSGNGDSQFTMYGQNVTPNQHALAEQFGLYDNMYDPATNSAEGHNWAMQGDDPFYTESSAGEYQRSYDTEDDVLGHQRSGFIWSGAQAAGNTIRDFGEFNEFESYPKGNDWDTFYCDALNMDQTGQPTTINQVTSSPIPSLNNFTVHAYPKFDTGIPDLYRYEIWKQDFEQNGPANLNMMWLSSDHTGGPLNPAAQVADDDLALGKIVETISHSKYWPQSAIFVMEDDTQAGVDHVDGHRGPFQIISPWAQHGVVDNTYYSQITMVRTIEQILGIHPMNQMDSAATPMFGAFTDTPDYTPFNAVPNQTSLTLGLTEPEPSCGYDNGPLTLSGPQSSKMRIGRKFAVAQPSTVVPVSERKVAALWQRWLSHQRLTGPGAVPDFADPEQMNRYTWYATYDWKKPYPGDSKIYAPNQVPGAYIPASDSGQ